MWDIEFYQTKAGNYPVSDFIDSLDKKSQAKIARTLDLLEEFGIDLSAPYTRYLKDNLWELRIRHSTNRYRIIYFLYTGKKYILLHGFTKKTGPVSKSDIHVASERRDNYMSHKRD